jgi:hypothetical protein
VSHIFHRCFNVTVTFFNTRPDTVEKEPLNPETPRTVGNLGTNLDCPRYVESNGYFFFGNKFFFLEINSVTRVFRTGRHKKIERIRINLSHLGLVSGLCQGSRAFPSLEP